MSRLRGDKARRLEDDRLAALGAASRDRSKSLCVERLTGLLRPGYDPATIAARDLNLHALQRRRASSALWVQSCSNSKVIEYYVIFPSKKWLDVCDMEVGVFVGW